jgi:predicted nucleotidyltransferase
MREHNLEMTDLPLALDLDREGIEAFCRKWRITELSLFGSVLQPAEFRDDSDVDVLVTFDDDARWSLFDLVEMQDELEAIIGRDVDLVEKIAVERSPNYIRRRHILESQRTFYVSR